MADRTGYHHGDLRRTLLDGARVLLREGGAGALSLREVARRAGVSHAAPYHHFASREELLAAVTAQAFDEMDRAIAEAQAAAPDTAEAQLVAAGMGYFLFALREPAVFRIMMRPEHGSVPRDPGAAKGPYARLQAALGRLLGAPADEESTHLCWAAVHGLACLALDGSLEVAPGALTVHARAVLGRLAAGIGAAARAGERAGAP